jgi:hypothetical protein
MDGALKTLGADINAMLNAERASGLALGQWSYRDSVPPLGDYWQAQLTEELTNMPGRSFSLVSAGREGAEWMLAGEILNLAGTLRVYTRLIQVSGHSVRAVFHSDFAYEDYFAELLAPGGIDPSFPVSRDLHEPDSWENPYPLTLTFGEEGTPLNRTLHNGGDEDFFLLVPDRDGALVMETTGPIDTYLELYEAGARDQIAEDDDGGPGGNARLRRNIRAGNRYIARVRGYDSGETGSYGFRAFVTDQIRLSPDEYEDDNEFSVAGDLPLGTVQRRTFHHGNDVDWIRFTVDRAGPYVIRARGLNSPQLDTYIELYDSGNNLIDDDDDGGENLDSRLARHLRAGTYYLRVICLDDEPYQPYTLRVDPE